jgi:glyoxylase-like metal-dependent hydrolase (beta-lactamase superfamily II)
MLRKSRLALILALTVSLKAPLAFAVDGVTVIPKTTGWFRTDFRYMADGAAPEKVRIPIPFYVIRHPQGIVLFDSGLGVDFKEQTRGWWGHRVVEALFPPEFESEDAALHQLKAMGIPPEDVRYIVVSHLHYDHAGGLRDFPLSAVVVSQAEWRRANSGRWLARLRGIMTEQLVGLADRVRVVDYGSGDRFDLFGDGALIVLSTPGHTPGHQSLLVTTGSGKKVLLTGDAVWVRENYQWPAPKSFWIRHLEEEADTAWATTLKIREFAERNPDALIVPGHDPRLWKELPPEIR